MGVRPSPARGEGRALPLRRARREKLIHVPPYAISTAWAPFSVPASVSHAASRIRARADFSASPQPVAALLSRPG